MTVPNAPDSLQAHWDGVYISKPHDTVSWYQPHSMISLDMIAQAGLPADGSLIDVGAGASALVDDLLALHRYRLTVLDIAPQALAVSQKRLGEQAAQVSWIVGDVTRVDLPAQAFDVWHDRAVFHFLTDAADRTAYVAQVARAVKPGGHVILATFASDGPEQCSGLPVVRYEPADLAAIFASAFTLVSSRRESHVTPAGRVQHFVYCDFVKR